jgi:prepilin signal peptidase PulO-like enzyme (type II secretory pathway)
MLDRFPVRPVPARRWLVVALADDAHRLQPQRWDQVRLAFSSFLMLFVELALIRWITANNVYVTEATNFVLLASFLGIGIGFLNAASGRDYLRWTPVALLALVGFVLAFPVILHAKKGPDQFTGAGQIPALPQPVSFSVVFLLTVAVMAMETAVASMPISIMLPGPQRKILDPM